MQRFWWTVTCTCGWTYPVAPQLAPHKDADMQARRHRDTCTYRTGETP